MQRRMFLLKLLGVAAGGAVLAACGSRDTPVNDTAGIPDHQPAPLDAGPDYPPLPDLQGYSDGVAWQPDLPRPPQPDAGIAPQPDTLGGLPDAMVLPKKDM